MSHPSLLTPLRCLFRDLPRSTPSTTIPCFLVPALLYTQARSFTTTRPRKSRVGASAITIPAEVSLRFFDLPKTKVQTRNPDEPGSAVEVVGPLGQMTLPLPPYVQAQHDVESKKVSISVDDPDSRHQRAMWGTTRALLQNTVTGVSEGHVRILRLVGVGYRATVEPVTALSKPSTQYDLEYPDQRFVVLKLGYAHPIEMPVPRGIKASVPQPTRILLEGPDRQVVAQFAAELREWRKPEPYKGKGIFVDGETIRLKAKKIK